MSLIKTEREIDLLRESGRRLARVLDQVERMIAPGVSTKALDTHAEKLIRDMGDIPSFLGYKPDGVHAYPASLCTSINDEVVHGIPREDRVLREGDIIGIDLGVTHRGMVTDMARTVAVGNIPEHTQTLIAATKEALSMGIAAARPGAYAGDIGIAIEAYMQGRGFSVAKELGGHGVGHQVHEEPFIANYNDGVRGPALVPGMVLALEPIFALGKGAVYLADDGFTFKTKDKSLSAHFEHTILITDGPAEILTQNV